MVRLYLVSSLFNTRKSSILPEVGGVCLIKKKLTSIDLTSRPFCLMNLIMFSLSSDLIEPETVIDFACLRELMAVLMMVPLSGLFFTKIMTPMAVASANNSKEMAMAMGFLILLMGGTAEMFGSRSSDSGDGVEICGGVIFVFTW